MDSALILAGGLGTRLRPLTDATPKPLLPVAGKPTIEWTLELLHKHGFKRVVLAIGYKAEIIEKHLGKSYRGMELIYSIEREALGTGGAIKFAEKYLKGTFLVINGDNLIDINIVKMAEHHKSANVLATVALTEVEDPSPFGVAVLKDNTITTFVEKPKKDEAPSNLINAGVYIMEHDLLNLIPKKGFCSLEKEIFQKIALEGKLAGFRFDGQWLPTDTLEKYELANKLWKG